MESMLRIFIACLVLATTVKANDCVRGILDYDNLTSMPVEILTAQNYTSTYSSHYIFTALEFTCSGAVTGWAALGYDDKKGGKAEISIWTPLENGKFMKRGGVDLTDCSGEEEVVDGTDVYLHVARNIELLPFQSGDVVGMLVRQQRSSDFSPIVVEKTAETTGYRRFRNGVYEDGFEVSPSSPTNFFPLISLTICVNDSSLNGSSYPNCSEVELPSEICLPEEPTTSAPSSPSAPFSPSPTPSTSSSPLVTSTLPILLLLVVAILIPFLLVLLLVIILVVVIIICCVRSQRKDKVDFSPNQTRRQTPSSLPMSSTEDLLGEESITIASSTHTYETPLMNRPSRPYVTVSCSYDEVPNGGGGVVTNNHTRSGSTTQASVYEEPLVSIPQYDSILGAPNQHVYDELVSPETANPPVFSRHNSPHLLPCPSPIATTRSPLYHTLEKNQRSPSPSPPLTRSHRLGKPTSPLARKVSSSPDYEEAMTGPRKFRGHSNSISSQCGSRLPPAYQIISTSTNLRVNSGVYVPTQQQRFQFSQEPLFDDSIYVDLSKAPNSPVSQNWSFFVETDHYWKPSSDQTELYDQLHSNKFREINRKQIQITEHLGAGEFGTVCKGYWHTKSGTLEVAIKMAQNQAAEKDKVRFLQEAAILGQFQHPNIVQLHGVVTVNDPVMILLELVKRGDLKKYLKTLRPVPGEMIEPQLKPRLLRFCIEVALGLEYLAKKGFVHRDIAARNILLTTDCTCKIADFGMSRDMEEHDYYKSNGGMVPFKWTAPEALHYRKYSTASDVWSYGILLWEIWSLGHSPYEECNTPEEATTLINSGARLLPPPGCPRAIYKHMMDCWNPKSTDRPTFTHLVKDLHRPSSHILTSSGSDGGNRKEEEEEEEEEVVGQANCLGADLAAGHTLYRDLQIIYSSISV